MAKPHARNSGPLRGFADQFGWLVTVNGQA
uniref:Uncharacterized protein n=1 Tax=Ralstonia solanacearum TaxID=305 RepID=A0A0S4W6P2_RALSL|nr:protein of unknown function [Ralstonia solanacearum]CUV42467.1 protein of unknown function [Ralstonia solanacearum]CUV62422.1 protein of unknown function [Ralstonia solanacearum]